eukprot:12863432-Heterocapsa_arctica.AAC.1
MQIVGDLLFLSKCRIHQRSGATYVANTEHCHIPSLRQGQDIATALHAAAHGSLLGCLDRLPRCLRLPLSFGL